MISRRGFLRLLLASPLAATVDVERLLWVPKPIITVPAMPWVSHAQMVADAWEKLVRDYPVDNIFESYWLLEHLKMAESADIHIPISYAVNGK